MKKRTKIIATLGPASSVEETIYSLINSGVDVFRLNFSHGAAADQVKVAKLVRDVSIQLNREVGLLADLQGPKIRVGRFVDGSAILQEGKSFVLDSQCSLGDDECVGLDYKALSHDVHPGNILLLDDGKIELEVTDIDGTRIICVVKRGGELKNNKGINRKGGGLSAAALTPKDMEDIKTAVQIGADFLAISFPKKSADMYMARQLMRAAGGNALLIAKIERSEAVTAFREILDASDGIMVARGDLAVEVGDAAVPALQKMMIRQAREINKITIIATQMMESMICSPVPTRAEVSDVANAVLDGTDAVMLSAETAAGQYPVCTVEAMVRVCLEAEAFDRSETPNNYFLTKTFERIDQAIAMAALFTVHHTQSSSIAAMTHTGTTALWLSRVNCGVPIYALSPLIESRRKMSIFRDVYPLPIENIVGDRDRLLNLAEEILLKNKCVKTGDLVVLTLGEPIGQSGGTNTMKVIQVDEKRDQSRKDSLPHV